MKIGELAERTGVPTKTIRFWESSGLVPEPGRTASGYRDYEADAIGRVEFIRHGQAGGLTLAQIRQILDIGQDGAAPCAHVTALIDQRLTEVEVRIADLTRTRTHLRRLAQRAESQDPAECEGYCSIITGGVRAGPPRLGERTTEFQAEAGTTR